jgi:hypothetical protein
LDFCPTRRKQRCELSEAGLVTRSRNDQITFLVDRKFGFRGKLADGGMVNITAERRAKKDPAVASEIAQYKRDLFSLTAQELQAHYDEEFQKYAGEVRQQADNEERERFFNQPHAAADFDHWSKAEHWTLDEAVALILGRAPEVVSWSKIESLKQISPFVKQYSRLRDLAARAKAWEKLYDPVLPLFFLKWASENEIDVPAELVEKVEKLKGKLVDWKKEFEEQKAAYDQLNTAFDKWRSMYDEHVEDWKKIVQQKVEVIAQAKGRIADLEAELSTVKDGPPIGGPAKAQSPIERQNMLKTIYAMAIKGYSYNPDDKRSTVVAEIVSDLSLVGLPVSGDTIRRYLKEARENLGEWQE